MSAFEASPPPGPDATTGATSTFPGEPCCVCGASCCCLLFRKEGIPNRFRDLVGVSVKEDGAVADPVSGVELLGISCAADSNYNAIEILNK